MVRPWLHYVVMSVALLISLLLLLSPCLRQLGKVAAIPWRTPWVFKLALAIYCGSLAQGTHLGCYQRNLLYVWGCRGCLNISHQKLAFTTEISIIPHMAKKAPET